MDKTLDHIHHIAVQVSDLKAALCWYQETFTVDVVYQDDSWALMAFDNVHLALVLPQQHPPHFAVLRDDAAQFGALTPHRDGTASVYIKDPAENAVEIMKGADD